MGDRLFTEPEVRKAARPVMDGEDLRQAFERLDDTGSDDVRITRRVGGNVGVDLLEVADGAQISSTAATCAGERG